MIIRAQQDDTVDLICWRHYGTTAGTTEAVYLANPGLSDVGPILPVGYPVTAPEIAQNTVTTKTTMIQLWD